MEGRSREAGAQLEVREVAIAKQRATVGHHDEWLDAKRLAALGDTTPALAGRARSGPLRRCLRAIRVASKQTGPTKLSQGPSHATLVTES